MANVPDLREQHRQIDQMRSTEHLDISKIRQSARALFEMRRTMSGETFRAQAEKDHSDFVTKYPQFFKQIQDESVSRIDESLDIMDKLLSRLESVQKGRLSHQELRETMFEKELADRYYKRPG